MEDSMVNPVSLNSLSRTRPATETDTTRAETTAARPGPAAALARDDVALSPGAARLPDALRSGPPIDQALVTRIGAAIAEGRYPVNPDAIATALMRELADFSDY